MLVGFGKPPLFAGAMQGVGRLVWEHFVLSSCWQWEVGMASDGYCRTGEVSRISAGRLGTVWTLLPGLGPYCSRSMSGSSQSPGATGRQLSPRRAGTSYCPRKNLISLIGLMRFLAGAITVS